MNTTSKYSILLVEDAEDDEKLILRVFQKMHLENKIIVKRDGEEALRYFFNQQDQLILDKEDFPEFVLLDLQLPRLSGLDVLQQLRAHSETKLLPIAVFTSSNETSDIQKAYQYGANSYVQKPVDMHEFTSSIHDLGSYWTLRNASVSPYEYN
ncbi:MAG: response regulator [Mariprofundaceae bacterium]|nr:response regulator [Mariprofundaceae bacterium]